MSAVTLVDPMRVGPITIDHNGRRVYRGDTLLALTRREFEVLSTLAEHRGQVLSKPQLLDLVWGYDGYDDNVVEAQISALRRKLGAAREVIETVYGFGYVIRGERELHNYFPA
jgi:two-component system response regulator PrrA